jgi:predicted glycosyltransferase
MIAGSSEASAFAVPQGVDYLALPGIRKDQEGRRHPRHLDIPFNDLAVLRSNAIRAAVEAFEPDVLLVDHLPWGAVHELRATLELVRAVGHTQVVLGLRDVLNEPEAVHRDWDTADNETAIREFYSAIWVYGDPAVYDLAHECGFSADIRSKMQFTGYLDQRARLVSLRSEAINPLTMLNLPPGPLILCMVGGGDDGGPLAEAFARTELPDGAHGVILTGPFMCSEFVCRLQPLAAARPRLHVLRFDVEPTALLERADRVIAMGGYNTVCEILSFEKRALIVPRVNPRREQMIRAERLRDLGLIDVLHPDELSQEALAQWLFRPLAPPPRARDLMNFEGLARLPQLLGNLLSLCPPRYEFGGSICHVGE